MAENTKTQVRKPVKKKKNHHITGFIFWICLILVLAPMCVLGWMLWSSHMDSGTPVLGNRYEGDLDPAITKDQMNQVENAVKGIEGVDDSFVVMQTATLRVYADVADDASEETVNAVADNVYNAVAGVLDPAVYFTKTDDKKMYDMEIHVYTLPERTDAEGENFIYVIDTKTSNMAESVKQTVSSARDQEVADQLRQDVIDRKAAEEAAAQASAEAEEGGEISTGEDTQGEAVEGEGE